MYRSTFSCAALISFAIAACSQNSENEDSDPPGESHAIRYTEFGIPHIRAGDYDAIGYGQGYAQARDNLCKIERGMLALEGKLSRHFGPDAPGTEFIGKDTTSLASDFYFRSITESRVVDDLAAQPAPLGPREEVRTLVKGFVDGFNAYLAENEDFECSGAAWVRPMQEIDVYRRVYAVELRMGQAFFASAIVNAKLPAESMEASRTNHGREAALALQDELGSRDRLPGSNAIALGRDATVSGRGINVANPHLSWSDDMRWWQTQLTIPGQLDVAGATLIGVPLVVMGHTDSVSFSITTAEQTRRVAVFELTLVDGSPTTYTVDGVEVEMQRRDVAIEVLQPGGTLETRTNVQYWTPFGPVIGEGSFLPLPPWSAGGDGQPGHAHVIRDANATSMRMLNTLFEFNHAKSTDDVLRAIRETQGVPWWSVLAADAEGNTLFSQIQVLPNVSDAFAARCNTELGQALHAMAGFAVLDASRSDCALPTDADAVEPGIIGPGELDDPRLPYATGTRYFENSNDSHWMPSADVTIEGMPRIVGLEKAERDIRTRGLIKEIEEQVSAGGYTREGVEAMIFSHRSFAAELAVSDTVRLCRELEGGTAEATDGERVDVSPACDVLDRWDHRMDSKSRGALLFSRYWSRAFNHAVVEGVSLFSEAFSLEAPLDTPRTLDVAAPFFARALADAVQELRAAGIPLDAELGDYQYVERGGKRFPLSGGANELGVVNVIEGPFGPNGFTERQHGSGYMHVVAFDGSPCPDAVTLLGYSQAEESSSPHHNDQTALYSQKRWVTERFCETDILASPELQVVRFER
jgi:acyl-homoserine-lactone acylase